MLDDIHTEAQASMHKAIDSLNHGFKRIRTGRATPALLETVTVSYYGNDVPVTQVANITVEDGRTLAITPWEKPMVPNIEKAIMKSDLGLNPSTSGDTIRVCMPMLTEETRKDFIKQARAEAEKARVAVRNARRDANQTIKDCVKDKLFSEDEGHRGEERIQKLTDTVVAQIDQLLQQKEAELIKV